MAKERKRKSIDEMTPTEQKKRFKTISRLCFGGEFISVILPFFVIGIVNFNDYFVEYNGTKMSIACVLAISLMGVATWLVAKNKFSNSFITLIIGWLVIDIIFWLLGSIINDMAIIMMFGLIGILGAYGLDICSKKATKKAEAISKGIEQATTENIAQAYKNELQDKDNKKKVKVKIIKNK